MCQWATWRDARGRGLAADRSRQVLDHPLSCGAQHAVGEVGAAHHELRYSRIELHGSNDFKSSLRDVILDQMGGHVAPPEPRQKHRLLRAEVSQAPRAARQYAVVTSCGQRAANASNVLWVWCPTATSVPDAGWSRGAATTRATRTSTGSASIRTTARRLHGLTSRASSRRSTGIRQTEADHDR